MSETNPRHVTPSDGHVERVVRWTLDGVPSIPPVRCPFRHAETYFQPTSLVLRQSVGLDGKERRINIKVTGPIITKSGALGKNRDHKEWFSNNDLPQWIHDIIDSTVAQPIIPIR